ncbi:hypothetical protein N7462_006789, partial [Penicillium macrosclerotiorum]|uniref:uncharacterized protein n=1 Tax=Penicillium macrosclerotiorum TaxID=303699 RepID=UPI0025469599
MATNISCPSSDPGRPMGAAQRDCTSVSAINELRGYREAVELQHITTGEDEEHLDSSSPSVSSGEEYVRVSTRRRTSSLPQVRQPGVQRKGPWGSVARFWTQHVTRTVAHKKNRDHFALERTFLAYIRTSVVVAMQGVVIAQLFRLQESGDRLKFYEAGIPLSVTCHCVAILVALIGAFRFWRQQNAIVLGNVHAGGWELNAVGLLLFAIVLVTLILSIAIIVEIDTSSASVGQLTQA